MSIRVLISYSLSPPERLLEMVRAVDEQLDVRWCVYQDPELVRSAKRQGLPFEEPPPDPAFLDELAVAEVVLGLDLPMRAAARAPRLRWFQSVGAGVEHLVPVGLDPSVVVTNASSVWGVSVAEFALARVLGVWKRTAELDDLQRRRQWQLTTGRTLAGSTMVVVGLGAIGSALAERGRALGVAVYGVRRNPVAHPACEEVVGPGRLHEVLARADVVVSTVPATSETFDLFDARAFAAMKPGTTFCNVARGSVVDEDALVAALRTGHLHAAIIDVVRNEPLPEDSALWTVPNLVLSPHSAVATDWQDGLFGLFTENLTRWIEGRDVLNIVPDEYLGRSR